MQNTKYTIKTSNPEHQKKTKYINNKYKNKK